MSVEITTRTRHTHNIAELSFDFGNAKVVEDVATYSRQGYRVEDGVINQLISAAFDFTRFNSVSDIDTILTIVEEYLTNSEKEQLLEKLQESIQPTTEKA